MAQTPTNPPGRVLTPAEQRQKEKNDREIQRERQIRAEWLQKQREYEAKQAEKERQRAAKKAGKPIEPAVEVAKPAATTPAKAVEPPVIDQPATAAPTAVEPARKEKKEKRKKEVKEVVPKAEPAPVVEPAPVTTPAVETPAPVKEPRPERVRVKREKKPRPVDSVATLPTPAREETVTRPGKEFLPKGHLFDPILLDPLEAQTYGSVLPGYWTEGKKYKGSIVPFAFGFAKPFYRRTTDATHAEEWVLDLASFTQFEAYHDDVAGRARRRIVNNDYKISIIYNVRRGENNYRFRVYHLSSHLGDDYIFRNKITAPSPNSVNYELLDATYSRTVDNWRLYGGLGVVLRKSEERKPLSAQLGAFYKKPSTHAARLVGGVDIKFWQQTNFRPGIHGGIGIELGRTQNNLTFLFEGYSGFRPYSQFEGEQTTWLGVGLYLNPF
ncbi:hypothetical protein GCM10027085_20470 [Spirosoma aerophilum]